MFAPNSQFTQKLDSDTRSYLVGYPNFPFGFSNWTPFTRCSQKRIGAKSIHFDLVPESTQHLEADRLDRLTAQPAPVEEPPNQPKKSPVREPPPEEPDRAPPQNPPPPPGGPPVDEPPNEPGKPPVKEPPPKDPDRQPPQKPPIRAGRIMP